MNHHLVGAEHLFLLGDNTLNSRDSRWSDVGDVPAAQVIGPVVFRLWPPARIGGVR
jgi:signal peptidase I